MLRFFRQIRKNLMEQNKTRSYIYYAIGEIVLVMIGILLALQVSNWNEERIEQTKRSTFIESIHEDLKADTLFLGNLLQDIKISNNELNAAKSRFNSDGFTKDSLVRFAKYELDAFMFPFTGYNNNTYESMKTSGNLSLIEDPLKRELFELSVIQADAENTYSTFEDVYFDAVLAHATAYPVPASITFIAKGPVSEFIWQDINEKHLAQSINTWGTTKTNFYRLSTLHFTEVLNKTKTIIEMIDTMEL